eukprot:7180457-Prorocentrum_lima.AAC.1
MPPRWCAQLEEGSCGGGFTGASRGGGGGGAFTSGGGALVLLVVGRGGEGEKLPDEAPRRFP